MADLDINTMQYLSSVIMVFVAILMLLLWYRNKTTAIGLWCGFAILICIDTILSSFPEIRNAPGYVYLFNTISSYAYFCLMLGCLTFSDYRINKTLVWVLFISCALINALGALVTFPNEYRRAIIITYNSIGLLFSILAVMKLPTRVYMLEKYFLVSLLIVHIFIHCYWTYLNFDISNIGETLFTRSATPIFIILILIMIALQILSLGKIRYQLERVNERSVAIKKALSFAVQETNVANKSKSIFLTNMSHELRTPLNIILGFSEALKMEYLGPLSEKQKAFVENIRHGGERLLVLINDLLFLSNIETGNLKAELEKMKPEELLSDNKEDLILLARKYRCYVQIIEDFDGLNESDTVYVNRKWLKQILTVLVDNSAKYANRNSNIWINVFLFEDKNIRITVKDEGKGIPQDQQQNVFKPFNRAGIESKKIEGTGTGLAIAKGLAQAMGGDIDFESRKGFGTTFWLDIKLVTD